MNFEDKQSDWKKDVIAILAIILFGVLSTLLLIMLLSRDTADTASPPQRREVMELHEIAYDSLGPFYQSQDDITVYIRENGVWEPFLVLEASYPGEGNGGTLLLRRYLIQERRPWLSSEDRQMRAGLSPYTPLGRDGRRDFRYYPENTIDIWLETEYIQMFSESMQERILTTNIEVWDGWNHAPPGMNRNITVTETVPRRIFLLSENETGWMSGGFTRAREGEPIAYFYPERRYGNFQTRERLRFTRRAATLRYEYTGELSFRESIGGRPQHSWWLRSVRWTTATGTIAVIMSTGMGDSLESWNYTFIRPALTLPKDTIIELYEVNGKLVYVIHD